MNEKGNTVIRNRLHLIPTDENFEFRFEYEDILLKDQPSLPTELPEPGTPSKPMSTPISQNPVKTRSGRVIRKPTRYVEEC